MMQLSEGSISNIDKIVNIFNDSRVAQWKRAGPITQRSVDRNYALLNIFSIWIIIVKPSTIWADYFANYIELEYLDALFLKFFTNDIYYF